MLAGRILFARMRTMSSLNVAGLGQALFEESSDALFVFDPETDKLLDVNPMALKLTGFSRAQLLGRLASAVFRYDAPDDQQRLRQAAQTSRVFHSQNSYALHTAQESVTIPVHITVSRLHLKPKTLGNIHWDADKKSAVIRVLDAAHYRLPFNEMIQDMEFTVVHELIHLELSSLPRSDASRSAEEHAVNQIADALLRLERK